MSANKPVDHDFDRMFSRPAAWRKAKEAFGGYIITPMMQHMQDHIATANPREAMAVALHHYMTSDPKTRFQMMIAFWNWHHRCDDDQLAPLEPMPEAERLDGSDWYKNFEHDFFVAKKLIKKQAHEETAVAS